MREYAIYELQESMRRGERTARAMTEMYLQRIREVDPLIKSVIELNPDALKKGPADTKTLPERAGQKSPPDARARH